MKKVYFIIGFLLIGVVLFYSLKKYDIVKQFILKYGWIIDEKSVIIEETIIPKSFENAIIDYDAMLKKAGFNLSLYKGKTLKKYTFHLENHIDKDAYINVFTFKNKIAFADVIITRLDGYIHNINEVKYQNAS